MYCPGPQWRDSLMVHLLTGSHSTRMPDFVTHERPGRRTHIVMPSTKTLIPTANLTLFRDLKSPPSVPAIIDSFGYWGMEQGCACRSLTLFALRIYPGEWTPSFSKR